MSKKNKKAHGLKFYQGLALLFIGLKLTSHIDWSWWWVLSPLWITIIILYIKEVVEKNG